MKDRDIAVVVSNANKDVSAIETIDAIKNAGFTNVFIQWYNRDWKPTQEEQLEYIRKKGLNIIFAHLGYQNINDLWLEKEAGDKLVDRYKNDIKICRNNNIPMVIMHLTSKSEAPKYNEIGLKRLQEIVDYAQKLNIKVAKRAISDFDFEIDECYDGLECLNKVVVGNEYDLILMDIMMPNMSGETAIKKLKENSNFRIPVIALTADAVSGAKEKYVSEGFVDYIAKPFNKDQIKQKLDIIFNDRNMSNTNKR